MGLPKRIKGLRTTCLVLFNVFYATLADSPNHSHANPKIVYVSPFSSEARIQHSASERDGNSVHPLPGTSSSYATNQHLPILQPHDYSNAQVVEDPKYAVAGAAEEPLHLHVQTPSVAEDDVNVHVQSPTHVDETLHIHVDVPDPQPTYGQESEPIVEEYGVEPQQETYEPEPQEAPPAPQLGLLQLLPLFVITVLAVIASTIVGALLG